MNYRESRDYITKISKYGSVLGLDSITSLMMRLGNPQNKIPVVHFAGTNGKGSTIAYTESILLKAGYKVGKYTSPAVFHERESFQIDGEYISEEKYARYMSKVKKAADEMIASGENHPTPFEVETALAFMYFYYSQCDIVLLETGMGGETDATNVVKKVLCSVITSVSMDHVSFLGDSIEQIAKVKAGIIKKECPVILSRQSGEVTKVVKSIAEKKKAVLVIPEEVRNVYVDKDKRTVFDYESTGFGKNNAARMKVKNGNNLFGENTTGEKEEVVVSDRMTFYNIKTGMAGMYQPDNAVTAVEVAKVLEKQGFKLKNSIKKGIENAYIPGRFEKISDDPLIIIDGAHNPGAAEKLKYSIEMYFTNRRITFIMGVLADKDYQKVAEITAPLADNIITVTPNNSRALGADELKQAVQKYNPNVIVAPTMESALAKAIIKAKNKETDVIVVFGTLSNLSEVKGMVR